MLTPEEETPTMKNLNRYITNMYAADWKAIGLELEFKSESLEIISKNNQQECVACFQNTLDNWLKSTSHATWRTLEVAITNVRRAKLGLDPVTDVYGEYKESLIYYMSLKLFIDRSTLVYLAIDKVDNLMKQ